MINAERLFRHGFHPDDFRELAANLLVVAPIKRPTQTAGGILTATDQRFEALCYLVVAQGPDEIVNLGDGYVSTNHLRVRVGDVVCIRNAFAEPIQEDRSLSVVDAMHVWNVMARKADIEAARLRDIDAEQEARLGIQAERDRLRKGL